MKYKNILFATDFSDCAKHAQAYAFAFALRSDAVLHVVHAVDPAYPAYAGVYGFGTEVENHLAELKTQADKDLKVVVQLVPAFAEKSPLAMVTGIGAGIASSDGVAEILIVIAGASATLLTVMFTLVATELPAESVFKTMKLSEPE